MPIDETEYQSLARDVREHMAREEKQWEDLIRAVRDNQRVIERVTTQLEAHAVLLDELKDPLDAWRNGPDRGSVVRRSISYGRIRSFHLTFSANLNRTNRVSLFVLLSDVPWTVRQHGGPRALGIPS